MQQNNNIYQKIVSNAVPALDMLAYQDSAVVSQTLIKKDIGTVTLFAFSSGEGLSEHSAPYDALIYVLDGETEIRIGGEPHHVKAGELIIMPANIPHALRAITDFKMIITMIKQ
jgi:quercetin dioxygenase-like cupin family protein